MAAAYDNFDYPAYWIGREYEHKSEVIALRSLLAKVHKIDTLMEVGAGFGRLTPFYSYRAKKITLCDPSSRLLKVARALYTDKRKYKFIHSSLENLPSKVKKGSLDVIVIVRVMHHLQDIDGSFDVLNSLLKTNGYLILEYANKRNLKAVIRNVIKGNFSFVSDTSRHDLRSAQNIRKRALPFYNYHPANIAEFMRKHGFEIKETRSVSNFRSTFLKKVMPTELLLNFEAGIQKLLSYIYFGPSIFVLARKKG